MPSAASRPTSDVIFISVATAMGGPARSLLTALTHLDDGTGKVLFAPTGALANAAVRAGAVDEHVELPTDPRRPRWSRIRAAIELDRYARANRHRLRAIHANGQTELNLAVLASLRSAVPVVMWAHASRRNPTAGLLRGVWRRSRRVRWLAVSSGAAQVLADTLHLGPDEVSIVANPIDPADVQATDRHAHDGIAVGYLGLATPDKGFDLLAPILDRVDVPDVRLLLYVAPPRPDLPLDLRPPWDALAALDGNRSVHLLGRVRDVRTAYRNLDIVLCPSRAESFGRVAAEAMANGIPVLASDIPAHRDLVGKGAGGLLFPSGDVDTAAAALTRLATDPDLRRSLGAHGRRRAATYAPDAIVAQLADAYRDAGSTSARPP